MADDEGYEDRGATVVPVKVGSRSGPGWIVAATAVFVAVVTFAFGYRLGNAPPAPSPTPRPTIAPTLAPSPVPTPAAVASPDVAQGVSRRLRGAVSAAGGPVIGQWVICTIASGPQCMPLDHQPLDRLSETVAFDFSEGDWARVTPGSVQAGDVVVAAPLGGRAIVAMFAEVGQQRDPAGSRPVTAVNADQQGVYFIDLGRLSPGRYVVAIGNLAETAEPINGLGPAYAWESSYAGIEVLPTAADASASPGASASADPNQASLGYASAEMGFAATSPLGVWWSNFLYSPANPVGVVTFADGTLLGGDLYSSFIVVATGTRTQPAFVGSIDDPATNDANGLTPITIWDATLDGLRSKFSTTFGGSVAGEMSLAGEPAVEIRGSHGAGLVVMALHRGRAYVILTSTAAIAGGGSGVAPDIDAFLASFRFLD